MYSGIYNIRQMKKEKEELIKKPDDMLHNRAKYTLI